MKNHREQNSITFKEYERSFNLLRPDFYIYGNKKT
jgi:hypothetical protein